MSKVKMSENMVKRSHFCSKDIINRVSNDLEKMYYVPNDWKLSQNYVEPFRFVLTLILLELQPSKEVSFFSVQILTRDKLR